MFADPAGEVTHRVPGVTGQGGLSGELVATCAVEGFVLF